MTIGHIVIVENWFDGFVTEAYEGLDENEVGCLYVQRDVLSTEFDHWVFMDGDDAHGKVKAFVKKLKKLGVPSDQITKYKISE